MTFTHETFKPGAQRSTIQVKLPDSSYISGPINSRIEEFLLGAEEIGLIEFDATLIAAIADGRLRELSYRLISDTELAPVTLASSDGGRIYRRSLVFLLVTAVEGLWPDTRVNISYAVPDGGFYCELMNRPPFTAEEHAQLDSYMRQLVEEDHPISKRIVSLDEAANYYTKRGDDDKLRLLQYRSRDHLTMYTLLGRDEYYYGYMVPSTRYLKVFRILPVEKGFILQYPRSENPEKLGEITTYNKLSQVFHQADEWLNKVKIEDVGRLNQIISEERAQEMILIAEALHEQNVASIAAQIDARHHDGARIVLIAGPSSSGKTTFSKRLAIQLMARGLIPFTLELDNYFVDRELTPRDAKGDYDFESIDAINRTLFNDHLNHLLRGDPVQLQRFDFITGRSVPGNTAQLQDRQLIILEGIHGLNPDLVPTIPSDRIFRIYVSALTQLNIDNHNRVPTTDVRLLRRIVRDARTRGYNARDTLTRWRSVRQGEKRNIFPYQENADVMFNSTLVYELGALRPLVEPLLLQVEQATPPFIEANRLLSFLRWVQPFSVRQQNMIPDTSLLREFIGGSILDDYHPFHLTPGDPFS